MKKIIPLLAITLVIFTSLNASASCRPVTKAESLKLNSSACQYFERIYGNQISVNLKFCAEKSKFTICENDPQHGTYIYGKLAFADPASSTASRDSANCNMSIVNQKIAGADCGDE